MSKAVPVLIALLIFHVAPQALSEGFNTRVRVYVTSDCQDLLQNYDELIKHDDVLAFYGKRLPYFEFSNFWEAPITLHGKVWPSSEHYFQAMKFEGTQHEEELRAILTPKDVAEKGRDRELPLRDDWEVVKDRIMLEAVYAKFSQDSYLRKVLLSSDDKILIEHTEKDEYWGDKLDGSGSNKLGITLMVVRDILRNEASNPQLSIPEFMWVKFVAEEKGYRVALSGNAYMGDARNYDRAWLQKSLKDPMTTESRLVDAYHMGTPETRLRAEAYDPNDEPNFNDICLFVSKPDGGAISDTELSEFSATVHKGLVKDHGRAEMSATGKQWRYRFNNRRFEDKESTQPILITNGRKVAGTFH